MLMVYTYAFILSIDYYYICVCICVYYGWPALDMGTLATQKSLFKD